MTDLSDLGVRELRYGMAAGTIGREEPVEASLARVARWEPTLNAFTEVLHQPLSDHTGGPLQGIPIAVKDVFVDRDRVPTAGSRVGAGWLRGTATVVKRLRAAGACIVGYTNLHEWGLDCTAAVSATGPVRNPWAPDCIAGGSSGGSAAALAAGVVPGAVGTDTGGSIRIPAACCGVVGFKPTWGRVPLDGYLDEGSPIDHAGPMARSVGDARVLFGVLAAATVEPIDVGTLRVGVPRAGFFDEVGTEIGEALSTAIGALSRFVARVTEVEIPAAREAMRGVAGIFVPRTYARLARDLDERPEAFQPETRRLLSSARDTTEAARAGAESIRRRAVQSWDEVLSDVDVVVTPTLSRTPPTIEECSLTSRLGTSLPTIPYLALNAPMNLAGVPALTLPCGESGRWAVSMTLSARRGRDDVALAVGEALERALDFRYVNRLAPLSAALDPCDAGTISPGP